MGSGASAQFEEFNGRVLAYKASNDALQVEVDDLREKATEHWNHLTMECMIKAIDDELGLDAARETKRVLATILSNIVQCPNESKFRSLRKSNQKIASDILRSDAAVASLLLAGFENRVEVLHFPEAADLTKMRSLLHVLTATIGEAAVEESGGRSKSKFVERLHVEVSTGREQQITPPSEEKNVNKHLGTQSQKPLEAVRNLDHLHAFAGKHMNIEDVDLWSLTIPELQVQLQKHGISSSSSIFDKEKLVATLQIAKLQSALNIFAEAHAPPLASQTSPNSGDVDLWSLSIAELLAKLRKLGISSSACKDKAELVALLQEHVAQDSFPDRPAPPGDKFRGLSVEFVSARSGGLIDDLRVKEEEKVYDIEPRLREKGEGKTCPCDSRPGAAYVDVAPDPNAGHATHMLSYGWGYRVFAIKDALESFCSDRCFDKKLVRVWICFACVNQHRVQEARSKGEVIPFEEFEEVFGSRVSGIGRILALLAPWDKPLYITRVWCVYELYTAVTTENVKLDIIVPAEEKQRFRQSLVDYGVIRAVWETIKSVNVEKAEASVEEDKRKILALIEDKDKGPGCAVLNHAVMKKLQAWFAETSAVHLEEQLIAKSFPKEMQFLCVEFSKLMGDFGEKERILQAVRLLELALGLPELVHDNIASAALRCQLGQRLLDLSNFQSAAQELKRANDVYEDSVMALERGMVLIVVVGLYGRFGDMKSVQCAFEQAKAVLADHPEHLASLYQKLAAVHLEEARKNSKEEAQKAKNISSAIDALEHIDNLYKQLRRIDTIDYVTCMTQLGKAYMELANHTFSVQDRAWQQHCQGAVKCAREYLDRAWASLDTIGMTESVSAAHVLMARSSLKMYEVQAKAVDHFDFKAKMFKHDVKEDPDFIQATKIMIACGHEKDQELELLNGMGNQMKNTLEVMHDGIGKLGRENKEAEAISKLLPDDKKADFFLKLASVFQFDTIADGLGQLGDRMLSETPLLPSWRAWTHPDLKLCPDVSEIAARVVTLISSEDVGSEDFKAQKLCQDMLAKLSTQKTTLSKHAASRANPTPGTCWIEYLSLVRSCSQHLGVKATKDIVRFQEEELFLSRENNPSKKVKATGGLVEELFGKELAGKASREKVDAFESSVSAMMENRAKLGPALAKLQQAKAMQRAADQLGIQQSALDQLGIQRGFLTDTGKGKGKGDILNAFGGMLGGSAGEGKGKGFEEDPYSQACCVQ